MYQQHEYNYDQVGKSQSDQAHEEKMMMHETATQHTGISLTQPFHNNNASQHLNLDLDLVERCSYTYIVTSAYNKMRLSSSVVSSSILLAASSSFQLALGREEDRFNYRSTDGNDYGPADWSKVTCDQPGECPGWPDGWELGIGWELDTNKCEWCPENGQHSCGLHRQSPIDLYRADSTTGHDTEW